MRHLLGWSLFGAGTWLVSLGVRLLPAEVSKACRRALVMDHLPHSQPTRTAARHVTDCTVTMTEAEWTQAIEDGRVSYTVAQSGTDADLVTWLESAAKVVH